MATTPRMLDVHILVEGDWQVATGEIERWLASEIKTRADAEFLLDFLSTRSNRVAPAADLGMAIAAIFVSLIAVALSLADGVNDAWLFAGILSVVIAAGLVTVVFIGYSFLARSRSHQDLVLFTGVRAAVLDDARARSASTWIERIKTSREQILI